MSPVSPQQTAPVVVGGRHLGGGAQRAIAREAARDGWLEDFHRSTPRPATFSRQVRRRAARAARRAA